MSGGRPGRWRDHSRRALTITSSPGCSAMSGAAAVAQVARDRPPGRRRRGAGSRVGSRAQQLACVDERALSVSASAKAYRPGRSTAPLTPTQRCSTAVTVARRERQPQPLQRRRRSGSCRELEAQRRVCCRPRSRPPRTITTSPEAPCTKPPASSSASTSRVPPRSGLRPGRLTAPITQTNWLWYSATRTVTRGAARSAPASERRDARGDLRGGQPAHLHVAGARQPDRCRSSGPWGCATGRAGHRSTPRARRRDPRDRPRAPAPGRPARGAREAE